MVKLRVLPFWKFQMNFAITILKVNIVVSTFHGEPGLIGGEEGWEEHSEAV